MPYATRGDQPLRATARHFAYYLLEDLRDPLMDLPILAVVRFPPIGPTSAAGRPAPGLPA